MVKKDQAPLRIGFVSNTSWSIYNFRFGIIKRLKALGCEVVVIAPRDNFSAKIIAAGITYEALYLDNYGTNPINDGKTLLQLIRIYRRNRLDFVFHYTIKPNIYGSLAAKYTQIPSIAVTTGLGRLLSFKNRLVGLLSFSLYKLALRFSREVWFLNRDDAAIFVRRKIIPSGKAFLLNSEGVNCRSFSPTNFDLKGNGRFHFLYAGRILRDKGIMEFAAVAALLKERYPNIHFSILGFIDGNHPNAVSPFQIVRWQREGRLTYLGEATDVRPYIDQADCLVFPSYYREGVSRILLEAAAMAKPIITTDHVGCREVVEHGTNGLLCRPRDVESLCKAIEQFLLMADDDRFKLGWNGRKKVLKEFDEELVIEIYLEKLQQYLPASKASLKKTERLLK